MARPEALTSGHGASALLLLLPGALMRPQHMVDAGMFEAVRQRSLDLDLMAVDLHALGGSHSDALRVLAEELVLPARASYQKIWLAGISRGGQLALSCLAEQAMAVDGVCLLAPYPGSRLTINAIERAGGLNAWIASEEQLKDSEFRLWQWLRQPELEMPIFLGYGAQDRLADGMQRLANQLPMAEQVLIEGGHDWAAWMPLWERFLDAGHFKEVE
jgi:pimeloyl-ACP methyl ester carboxylesterase